MRINQYISQAMAISRRETDRLLKVGRITVNGSVCEMGQIVGPDDIVRIDGKTIKNKVKLVYIILNKPAGITCTAASHIEGNIIDFIGYHERIFPVGRLDKASEGLILMTNDGELSHAISHGDHKHEKEYLVTLNNPFSNEFISGMAQGVQIPGAVTKPCVVERVSDDEFRIILTQGLNRQIRRMCRAFGYTVIKLERIRIMGISLGDLPRGQWRHLTEEEVSGINNGLIL
ncbi:23S rRNA pseudouridine2604 synthase [Fictibacillus enclensis]|uniref:Pseudouridine synthase n=1 Tax=Fictibacillus enclensis TaxID=1017270 RepID=A0A0V8J1R2_9BACL|nr:23S rRNA pseudouridine(2604) synthase RluF [Fictibacillus enclensis]KSU81041.1 23S rRNA pseudouridine synthase F [Fictibacillus enclensis]SCC34378.1 23S rRNA pseudouridine2604 synthase [Fictibacillus enclensis]